VNVLATIAWSTRMNPENQRTLARIKGEEHWISKADILRVAANEAPRRINAYYVDIDGRRFPPKQLVRAATGTKKFFDTAAAVRVLKALGFVVHPETEGSRTR
jgi:hypothetical protein